MEEIDLQINMFSPDLKRDITSGQNPVNIPRSNFSIKGWAESEKRILQGLHSTDLPLSRQMRSRQPINRSILKSRHLSETYTFNNHIAVSPPSCTDLLNQNLKPIRIHEYEEPSNLMRSVRMCQLQSSIVYTPHVAPFLRSRGYREPGKGEIDYVHARGDHVVSDQRFPREKQNINGDKGYNDREKKKEKNSTDNEIEHQKKKEYSAEILQHEIEKQTFQRQHASKQQRIQENELLHDNRKRNAKEFRQNTCNELEKSKLEKVDSTACKFEEEKISNELKYEEDENAKVTNGTRSNFSDSSPFQLESYTRLPGPNLPGEAISVPQEVISPLQINEEKGTLQYHQQVAARTINHLTINNYYRTPPNNPKASPDQQEISFSSLPNRNCFYPHPDSLFRPITPKERTSSIVPIPHNSNILSDEDFGSSGVSRIDLSSSWTNIHSNESLSDIDSDDLSSVASDLVDDFNKNSEEQVINEMEHFPLNADEELHKTSPIVQTVTEVVKDNIFKQESMQEQCNSSEHEGEFESENDNSLTEDSQSTIETETESKKDQIGEARDTVEDEEDVCETDATQENITEYGGGDAFKSESKGKEITGDEPPVAIVGNAREVSTTVTPIQADIRTTQMDHANTKKVQESKLQNDAREPKSELKTIKKEKNECKEIIVAKPPLPPTKNKTDISKRETSKIQTSKMDTQKPKKTKIEISNQDSSQSRTPDDKKNDFRASLFQASTFKNPEPAAKKSETSFSSYSSSYYGTSKWKRFKRRLKRIFCCGCRRDYDEDSYSYYSSDEDDWRAVTG